MLDFDSSFKHKLRRAGEAHVGKPTVGFLETDFQFVAAFNVDSNRRYQLVNAGTDQGGSGHAGAAGKGFAFNTTLKGANPNAV